MAQVATNDQKTDMRRKGQWSDLYVGIFYPHTVYSARLASLPSGTDMIAQIAFTSGVGTLGNVRPDSTLWVGTTAGSYDLGMARIRKAPIAGTFYIAEQSEIEWADSCYLTVVDDFDLKAKHLHISSGIPYMDYDVAYSDQHENFNPVPVLGPAVRVAKLEGATVDVQLGPETGYESWVIDSTITTILWAGTGVTFDNTAIARPVGTFSAPGWYVQYCTVTAANGKSKTGARYVYIWDDDNPPFKVAGTPDMDESTDGGGAGFRLSMVANADQTLIPDRALCVLFSVDHYDSYDGAGVDSVGPIAGAENIECIGRIVGESIRYDAIKSEIVFDVQGYQEWFKQIPGFPSGVEMTVQTAAAWTDMPALTVDRALWHFLEWRCTATVMMDIALTDDTRYELEVSSLAGDLWSQLEEIGGTRIFALSGVDIYGRFFMEIEPQLVPEASRDWVTVMDLAKTDYFSVVELERNKVSEISQVDFSGVAFDSAGVPATYFGLAPGHVPKTYGELRLDDRYLVDDQAGTNTIAGLILAWANNPVKPLSLNLLNNKLLSCFPRQYAGFVIEAADTARGITYDGLLIPRRRTLQFNPETGFKYYQVEFEAVVSESLAIDGDVPGSEGIDTTSFPPMPKFPPLPAFPVILPTDTVEPNDGARRVILHDPTYGLVYTANFHESSPTWIQINSGLTSGQYISIKRIVCTRNGSIYVTSAGLDPSIPPFIAWAPGPGQIFTILEDTTSIVAKHGSGALVNCIGRDRTQADRIAYVIGGTGSRKIYIGNGAGGFTVGATLPIGTGNQRWSSISFDETSGTWLMTAHDDDFFTQRIWLRISGDGQTLLSENTYDSSSQRCDFHIRAGSSPIVYAHSNTGVPYGAILIRSLDNMDTYTADLFPSTGIQGLDDDMCAIACDDTGQFLMGRYDTGKKGKSSDYASAWTGMGSLPVAGDWCFAWLGGRPGVNSVWGAAAGTSIRRSPDFGTTWENREGSAVAGFPLSAWDYIVSLDDLYD